MKMLIFVILTFPIFALANDIAFIYDNQDNGSNAIVNGADVRIYTYQGVLLGNFLTSLEEASITPDIVSGAYFFEIDAFKKTFRYPFQYDSDLKHTAHLCFNPNGAYFSVNRNTKYSCQKQDN